MRLKDVISELLHEQTPVDPLDTISALDNVIKFPNQNFTMSMFANEKKILLMPQQHKSVSGKIKALVSNLKRNFRIIDIADKDFNSLEITFDPRENFESIIDFVKQEAGIDIY